MTTISLIFSMLALTISIIGLLLSLNILTVNRNKEDKYQKYRNEDGLLTKKRIVGS